MAKKNSVFECQHCGYQTSKWQGKCTNCGAWEGLVELKQSQIQDLKMMKRLEGTHQSGPKAITEVNLESLDRFSSMQEEFDIVLGGGIVRGGLYLIGGSPGVGKSTLLLEVSGRLAKENKKVLYVSGEESMSQIKMRANRLDCVDERLFLLNEIELSIIKSHLVTREFEVCVIDSIQTIFSESISSAPGSVSQIREVTFELMRLAKEYGITIFIIGHITKEGSIAGPRVLEHMVDCVLYFDGDPSGELRILRGFKNRFGTTSDIGIFEMKENGLVSAKDASRLFFSQKGKAVGSAIATVLEGTRVLILEIQALVGESNFVNPKRMATGFEVNRLNMLLALLEKKFNIPLKDYDVFVNVAGGIKINETSADLAVVAAILSSLHNRPLSSDVAFIGEVSLIGDIREVSNIDARLKEMEGYGFKRAIVAKRPTQKSSIKCYEANEVTKILDWM